MNSSLVTRDRLPPAGLIGLVAGVLAGVGLTLCLSWLCGQSFPGEKLPELATRVYSLPSNFKIGEDPFQGGKPVAARAWLQSHGISFPAGSYAVLNQDQLVVRNSPENLDAVATVVLGYSLEVVRERKSYPLIVTVRMARVPATVSFASSSRRYADLAEQFSVFDDEFARRRRPEEFAAVLTDPAYQVLLRELDHAAGVECTSPTFVETKNGQRIKVSFAGDRWANVTPTIGPTGLTFELQIDHAARTAFVELWDGQTAAFTSSDPEQGKTVITFLTVSAINPSGTVPAARPSSQFDVRPSTFKVPYCP